MHKAKLETEIGVERQLRLGEEPREGGFTEVNLCGHSDYADMCQKKVKLLDF
jgi:hypothetical protein